MHEPPSESNYPLRQPRHNGHRRRPNDEFLPPIEDEDEDDEQEYDAPFEEEEEEELPRPQHRQRGIQHQRERISTPVLPHNRLKNTLIAGTIAGVLCMILSIIVTLANTSTYHAYDVAKDPAVKSALSFTIFGYNSLIFLISMLICVVTGFIVGKMVVERRLTFLAGVVTGFIVYLINFMLNFIPNYPGSNTSGGSAGAGATIGGIIFAIVLLLLWGIVGGLANLLGGWLATRRHPYYVG